LGGGIYRGGGEGGYIAGKLNLMFCCEGSPKSYVKFRGGLGGGVSIYRGGGKNAILGGFSVRRCHSPSDAVLPVFDVICKYWVCKLASWVLFRTGVNIIF
jgi:hypothetical protein